MPHQTAQDMTPLHDMVEGEVDPLLHELDVLGLGALLPEEAIDLELQGQQEGTGMDSTFYPLTCSSFDNFSK